MTRGLQPRDKYTHLGVCGQVNVALSVLSRIRVAWGTGRRRSDVVRGTGRSRGGALPTMEARTKGDAVSEASSEYSTVVEDILKLVWSAEEAGRDGVKPKDIGEHMGVVPSTTTENVQRLVRQGLVTHERYGRVRLTGQGRAVALGMVRRHRLLETYLRRGPWVSPGMRCTRRLKSSSMPCPSGC